MGESGAFQGSEGATELESDDTATKHKDAMDMPLIHRKIYITELELAYSFKLSQGWMAIQGFTRLSEVLSQH